MESAGKLANAAAGTILTPPAVAHFLAHRMMAQHQGVIRRVVDPAVGTGSLLAALEVRLPPRHSDVRLVGIDLDDELLERARTHFSQRATLLHQDALFLDQSEWCGQTDMLIANPPFVPEKGNKALFRKLAASPRWAERVTARCDLSYLFVHLALDLLRPGGTFGLVLPAYWPTATGAAVLREDLFRRARLLEIYDYGTARVFPEASGLHTMLLIGRRLSDSSHGAAPTVVCRARSRTVTTPDFLSPDDEAVVQTTWSPPSETQSGPWYLHISPKIQQVLDAIDQVSVSFSEFCCDRQGVVSGADRDNAGGLFILSSDEARRNPGLEEFLVPLVRGAEVRPFEVLTRGSGEFLLYLRGKDTSANKTILKHLQRARDRLEKRREVALGRRPWWALQWPRDPAVVQPGKLVCPRRAKHAVFGLDEVGLAASSDCTFIVRSAEEAPPLAALHKVLNSSLVDIQLQHRGKRKGHLIELYSQPLRSVRLPRSARFWGAVSSLPDLRPALLDQSIIQLLPVDEGIHEQLLEHAAERWSSGA